MKISTNLDENIQYMLTTFEDCGDIVKRKFAVGQDRSISMYIMYIDMLVDRKVIEEKVLMNLMVGIRIAPPSLWSIRDNILETLKDGGLTTADLTEQDDFKALCNGILSGDTVLFIDGAEKAFIISTKGWPNRGISKAETEVVVQGSKEAFNEVFRFSSVLIRRRIRDTNLKLVQMQVGRRSKTDIGIMYLKDVVRPQILNDTIEKIKNIDIDAILDCGYIEQFIEDDWMSPFPQVQVTERPDKAASAILEGRIVIIVDNSPFVLIVPVTLNAMYQASEDYYQRWHIMTLIRILRYISGVIALCMPAVYLATAVYHPSMLPTLLTFKLASARQTVPFPAVIEIVLMDGAFELLREAGIRLPGPIGNTIGIVGGIIIGQAAVEAGLVIPIVVIIVALTGICSFTIPSTSLVNGYRISKYILIFTAATLGLFGLWLGILIVMIHLVSLKSFGIPYMFPFASGDVNDYTDFKDSIIRMPLFMMKKRPIFARPGSKQRLNLPETGNKRQKE